MGGNKGKQSTEVLISAVKGYLYLLTNEWETLGDPEKRDLAVMSLDLVTEMNRRARNTDF